MNSTVERAIQVVKRTADRIAKEKNDLSLANCMRLAVAAHNQSENVKGYSPNQWVFGAASESMDETAFLWKDPDATYAKIEQIRTDARKAWLEEQLRREHT